MNWSAVLAPLKYFAGAVVTICLVSGLVWFAMNHWIICLGAIFIYVVYEICLGGEKEL